MKYALIQNSQVVEYPVFEGDIRARFSNISFGTNFIAPEEYAAVTDIPPPAVDYTKNITEGLPQKVNGEYVVTWIVEDASQKEIEERLYYKTQVNKKNRNTKLSDTDWTQLADVPLTADCKTAFAAYRQALRDLDMLDPTWPDAPAEEWVA